MNYKLLYEKQKELIDTLSAYSTHVVIMWNKDLEDDESKNLKLRLWEKVKEIKSELQSLEESASLPSHPEPAKEVKPSDDVTDGKEKRDPRMEEGSFIEWDCFDVEKDLYGNVNCSLHIDPKTCGREISCACCKNYLDKSVKPDFSEWKKRLEYIMGDGVKLGLNDWAIVDYCKAFLEAMRDNKIK